MLSERTENKLKEGAANSKQKDPYYFTFFNEKNDEKQENKDAPKDKPEEN